MKPRTFKAVEHAAVALFDDQPPFVRWHVKGRAKTCPFGAVAEALSGCRNLLDIGCGHGLFSFMLAFSNPEASITGIDTDDAKIAVAAKIALDRPDFKERMRFIATTTIPEEPYDGLAIVDVLYLLPRDSQEALVQSAARALGQGGVLAIKEMSQQPAVKYAWARIQEFLAVRILRITKGQTINFASPREISGWLRDEGLKPVEHHLGTGYLHPHHLITARRPSGGS